MSEYYTSSALFMSSSGVFLITTDGNELIQREEEELTEDKRYYSWVGSYVDLIANTAAKAKIQPKIQLVATKAEPETTEQIRRAGAKLLEMTKKHLEAVDGDISFFLVDEVHVTSSKKVTRELMEHLSLTLSTLSTNEQLNEKEEERTPTEWFATSKEMKKKTVMNMSQVAEIQKKMREKAGGDGNVDPKDVDSLKKFHSVVQQLTGEKRGEAMKEPVVRSEPQEDEEPNYVQISTPSPEEDTFPFEVESQAEDIGHREGMAEPEEKAPSVETTTKPENAKEGEDEGEKSKQEGSTTPGVSSELRTMLRYFSRKSEMLWFEGVPELENLVIPQPMAFVQSLRTIISHDVREKLKDKHGKLKGGEAKQEDEDIQQKGTMSYATFEKIFSQSKEVKFSSKQVWQFLIHLNLAIPILGKGESRILVPSLISDQTREKMMKRAEEQDDMISIQYVFDWNYKSLRCFHDLVETFTRLFFKEGGGGEIAQCFSQKIENRTLGCVAGVYGKFTRPRTSEKMEFTLLQFDEADKPNSFKSMHFPSLLEKLCRVVAYMLSFRHIKTIPTSNAVLAFIWKSSSFSSSLKQSLSYSRTL